MTDERIRKLERVAHGGTVEERARLIGERLRSGVLVLERLQLAAALGHEAAMAVTDGKCSVVRGPKDLLRWGKAVCVRAAASVALVTLRDFEAEFPSNDFPREWLNATAFHLLCPSAVTLKMIPLVLTPYITGCRDPAFEAARAAARAAQTSGPDDGRRSGSLAAEGLSWARESARSHKTADPWVQACGALSDWALGVHDDLLEHLLAMSPDRKAEKAHASWPRAASWPRQAIYHGTPKRARESIAKEMIALDKAYRKEHGVGLPDAMISALATFVAGDVGRIRDVEQRVIGDWRTVFCEIVKQVGGGEAPRPKARTRTVEVGDRVGAPAVSESVSATRPKGKKKVSRKGRERHG